MENPPLNYFICLNLLRSSVEHDEEYRRPWKECYISFSDQPLLHGIGFLEASQGGRIACYQELRANRCAREKCGKSRWPNTQNYRK